MTNRRTRYRVLVDPGTRTHGLVVLMGAEVLHAESAATTARVLDTVQMPNSLVIVERIQAHGIAGNDIIRTAEHSATFRAVAWLIGHNTVEWLYRRDVKAALDVRGRSSDSVIRSRLMEIDGADAWAKGRACPKRSNKSHGDDCPICGGSGMAVERGRLADVTGHAIQALALSYAYDAGARSRPD